MVRIIRMVAADEAVPATTSSLARVGARLQVRLDPRVLRAIMVRSVAPAERSRPATGLHDLEAIQRFASSSGAFTFFDAPWTPVFLFVLFAFHWMLGVLAVFSGCLLLAIALVNQARTGTLQQEAGEATANASHFIEQVRAGGETVQGLGMLHAVLARSGALRNLLLDKTLAASDRNGFYAGPLGAWLALRGEVTPGIMTAPERDAAGADPHRAAGAAGAAGGAEPDRGVAGGAVRGGARRCPGASASASPWRWRSTARPRW